MPTTDRAFIPAARFHWLTPVYDSLCRLLGLGAALRDFELELLESVEASDILEVGCGTGELLLRVARRFPSARVVGIDPDPRALRIAAKKLPPERDIRLVKGRAESLEFPDHSFDLVLSSLMLHHLDTESKIAALREWKRVLRPGGQIVLVDLGEPRSLTTKVLLYPLRFNLFEKQADNLRGKIPSFIQQVGLALSEAAVFRSAVVAYRAWLPGTPPRA
ncbi:MAG: class I SAM-dependent methyltransferase [Deltaproteobacteria bacterium]|nr:class I SAM-dependent methyltransferase [Deltaproteobacteria bacterium]